MVMRRLFGRKKEEKKEEKGTEEAVEEAAEAAAEETAAEAAEGPVPEPESAAAEESSPLEVVNEPAAESRPESAAPEETIPYHDSLQKRLKYLLEESEISSTIRPEDEFTIEIMAMGERVWVRKRAHGPIEYGTGAISDKDVFIRVANDVVRELLDAPNFTEFSRTYMHYYRNADPGKFVKIELRRSIDELTPRGYARCPLLKLLVGEWR